MGIKFSCMACTYAYLDAQRYRHIACSPFSASKQLCQSLFNSTQKRLTCFFSATSLTIGLKIQYTICVVRIYSYSKTSPWT